jgi:hypothetical protein
MLTRLLVAISSGESRVGLILHFIFPLVVDRTSLAEARSSVRNMSSTEKDKQANEVVDDGDEPDEWSACSLRVSSQPSQTDPQNRDKRIFSTGCAGNTL